MINVEVKKDPLSFKMTSTSAGSIAIFDNWDIQPVGQDNTWIVYQTNPKGRDDFAMLVVLGIPGTQAVQNLFVEGPKMTQQLLSGFNRVGEPKMTKYGGDEAMVENYEGQPKDKKILVQVVYVKKQDVSVGVMGIGTEAGFKEFGRSIDILAQSVTVKQSPLDPALVGRWGLERYTTYDSGGLNPDAAKFSYSSSRYITIYPNGTFTETSNSFINNRDSSGTGQATLAGGDRGRVVVRGDILSFQYDNGEVWNATYKLKEHDVLLLNGNQYLKS
ncbi:MAG: hypothetical protein HY535_04525 [Chloroflexi bacterium]|nr:hypothetical protein [Chloroflexota bacterium]